MVAINSAVEVVRGSSVIPIVACAGARKLSEQSIGTCRSIGSILAKSGVTVSTGAAVGADQAFARGCLESGGKVLLWLPWRKFERGFVQEMDETHGDRMECQVLSQVCDDLWEETVESLKHLPYEATNLYQMVKSLHQRNWLIVKPAHGMIAFPGTRSNSGGTRQSMRLGEHRGIPVLDLLAADWIDCALIKDFVERLAQSVG